ncbi:four helix bundle protein [Flavivirga sp. 57AJ16]|uniref:four helix bundle protein n=1 Tax=Flavivirga sp. 57AJ16 TaxID=3025307 RepID=UPI0023660F32|nr:four helix bundle protein [Flavivirga sp. 57AJ16]MDD7886863.1 four helix bundle protein [Flavivirga sp. 57AJ16]
MNYTELGIWKYLRELVKLVYKLTKSYPQEELYGLTNQIRRSVISVPSNIAEGCGRQSTKETIPFLYISRGSLYELETQLFLSNDLEFLPEEKLNNLLIQIQTWKKLLNEFINYYKKL